MNSKRVLSLLIVCPIVVCSAIALAQTSPLPPPSPQPQAEPPPRPLTQQQTPPSRSIGTPPLVPPAGVVSPQVGPGTVPGRLQNNMRRMNVGRANLNDVRNRNARSRGFVGQPRVQGSARDAFRARLDEMNRRREEEYARIRTRMDQVKPLFLGPPSSAIPGPLVPQTVPPLLPPPGAGNPRVQQPVQAPDQPKPPTPTEVPPADSKEPEIPEIPDESLEPDAEIVTDSAINRLALADNLFGSNDIENALRLYVELSREPGKVDAGDRLWIDYQIACSSRRLRKFDQARKFYRKVVAAKNGGVYPKLSKWWLEAMQRKEGYEATHAEIRMELDLK